jgi:hypothetical protein
MRIIGNRTLTHEEALTLKLSNQLQDKANDQIKNVGIKIQKIDLHVIDRIRDRKIDHCEFLKGLANILDYKLCELIYICFLDTQNKYSDLTVIYKKKFILHLTFNRNVNLIKIRTILNYRDDYKTNECVLVYK